MLEFVIALFSTPKKKKHRRTAAAALLFFWHHSLPGSMIRTCIAPLPDPEMGIVKLDGADCLFTIVPPVQLDV
jgi:hypothetical protein